MNSRNLYTYAKTAVLDLYFLGFGGPGLGNVLFPWARSVVAAHQIGASPIFPCFGHFHSRVLIRLRSKRTPENYRPLFYNPGTYVDGSEKAKAVFTLPRISESSLKGRGLPHRGIVILDGMNEFFQPFLKDHAFVRERLINMTRPEHLTGLNSSDFAGIAVHVRLGDFYPHPDGHRAGLCSWHTRTQMTWYLSAIAACRKAMGADTPVKVFSDGTDEELRPLLTVDGVSRASFGASIADLHALSRACVLIASGGSTFSMWASYLGRMPVIWPPKRLYCRLYYNRPALEIEFEPGSDLPEPFADRLRNYKNRVHASSRNCFLIETGMSTGKPLPVPQESGKC